MLKWQCSASSSCQRTQVEDLKKQMFCLHFLLLLSANGYKQFFFRDYVCKCGRNKSAHDRRVAREDTSNDQWTPERCTRQLPTNAYGEIDFLGQGKQAKRSPVSLSFFLCFRVWLFLRPCNLWTFFTQNYFRAEIIESSLSVSQHSSSL